MKIIGILFIVAGILMLVFGSFSFTQEKKAVDLGPIEINKKERKTVAWPKYAGGIAVLAGAVLVIAGSRKRES